MLKNHLITSFRNIWRNKLFSFIHIFGLSIGISASLVIFIIVAYEFSFDKFETGRDRIYRVVMDFKFNGDTGSGAAVPAALPNAIRNEVTGVDGNIPVMQFQGDASVDVSAVRNKTTETFKKQPDIIFTVNDYFQLIPFEWIAGSPTTSLTKPFSVVLTESRAKQYFPGVAPVDLLGRRLVYDKNLDVEITGVVKDFNEVTDFTSREFISYATIFETNLHSTFMMDVWDDWMAYSKSWVKLSAANDKDGVEKQLNALIRKYNPASHKDENNTQSFSLQPLSDVHFNTTYASFGVRTAHMPTLYALLVIAAFLLLLACINFVNLSTAQASHRAKEIGIRKTIGSSRKQLVVQFLYETLALTFLSTIVSISIVPLLLQLFSDFIPAGVGFDIINQPQLLLIPTGLLLVVGLIAGSYPALYLSKFKPVAVLKNAAFAGAPTRSEGLRKVLTVSQFAVAQFFVIAALMISKQIHFSLNQELGYRKDAIVNFNIPRDTVSSHVDRLVETIKSIPGVQLVSAGFLPPATEGGAYTNIKYNNGKEEISPNVQIRWGDPNFIELYKIDLVAGRNIRAGKNINEALINEAYAKELGFESPIDALQRELINPDGSTIPIVGVMRNFHEGSFHRPIGNIVFRASRGNNSFFHVALDPTRKNGWQGSIAGIDNAFHAIYPEADFSYKFFDESIAAFYNREQQTSKLLNWAMGLSVVISLLGLLGLVIYISEARTKEIGIRKVLGATVSNLVFILSREFVLLIVIAFMIATPVAWYAIDKWLQSFQFKTEISAWVFVVSGLALLVVAIITLAAQTIRTAMSNPIRSLRNE
ncbi:MAG: FtsX-like permease family protein [Bacteroidota bacterium]